MRQAINTKKEVKNVLYPQEAKLINRNYTTQGNNTYDIVYITILNGLDKGARK